MGLLPAGNDNVNPSNTGEVVGVYASGSREDALKAIEAAKTALYGWSHSSIQTRHDILQKASVRLREESEEIGRLLAREEGKTLKEGIAEVIRASQVMGFFAGKTLRIQGESLASVRPGVGVTVTREPAGAVGIISPWNFPIAIPAWKIAPALCYANTVVFKPADLVPGSAWKLVSILHEAGLPHGDLRPHLGGCDVKLRERERERG